MCLQRHVVVIFGSGDRFENRLEERFDRFGIGKLAVCGLVRARTPSFAGGVDHGDVEQCVEVNLGVVLREVLSEAEKEIRCFVDDRVDAGVGTINLVHDDDHGKARGKSFAQNESGLRERPLGRVHEQHDAVDHGQAALDLATEVGVAGGVDDVDDHRLAAAGRTGVVDRGVLREDGDALFALEVTGVHRTLVNFVAFAERAALAEHGVHEGRFAVIDVGDDRDVSKIGAVLNGHRSLICSGSAEVS